MPPGLEASRHTSEHEDNAQECCDEPCLSHMIPCHGEKKLLLQYNEASGLGLGHDTQALQPPPAGTAQ